MLKAERVTESIGSEYSEKERRGLVSLARQAIKLMLDGKGILSDQNYFSEHIKEKKSCFVTLTVRGQLRGCIGGFTPAPLYEAVINNATLAAFEDPRFRPLTKAEFPLLEIEISVLSAPTALKFSSPHDLIGKLRPEVDGVVLIRGGQRVTFLPQVWKQFPDPDKFLAELCKKEGWAENDWKKPGTKVEVYQAEIIQ